MPEKRGWSKVELAKRANMKSSYVHSALNSNSTASPPENYAKLIEKGLEITLKDFSRLLDLKAQGLEISEHDDYYRVLTRYQEFFDAFAQKPDVNTVVLPSRTHDPSLYVDLCHMTPEGIAELAAAFAPAVRKIAAELGE